MSVGPRIVFTRFASSDSPRLKTWREHVARVVGTGPATVAATTPDPKDGVMVWSLVSGNNRELARGGRTYVAFEDAVSGAEAAVANHETLDARLISDRRRGGYGWFLLHGPEPELVCSRWYESDRYRNQALAATRHALLSASLLSGTRIAFIPPGDRRAISAL